MSIALLDPENLPESFECVVKGRMALPQAALEIHDYRFHRPQQALFRSADGFLDLALSHRPGEAFGCYVDLPGSRPRPMGDVIFIPAGLGLSSRWGEGVQSSICCQWKQDPRQQALGDDACGTWSESQLDASLDVRNSFVRDALMRLGREIEAPGFCSTILAEAICIQISVELGRYFRGRQAQEGTGGSRLSPAQLRRIEERLAIAGRLPTVADLAAECGLSTRHFFRMFRTSTGTTLSDFAASLRITRAKTLLGRPSPPVKEIAYRCGFETSAAFSAAFRKATGCTPRQYRRDVAG